MPRAPRTTTPSAASTSSCFAVKSEAAVDTARDLREAIGSTPVLSVCSELAFGPGGVKPTPEATSIAQRIQDELDAPVVAGLHSLAASNLAEAPPEEDALVCGDDAEAKELALELAGEARLRPRRRLRPAGERPRARRHDRGDRQREQALQGARGHARHRPALTAEIRIFPLEGIPEVEEGDDLVALLADAAERAGGLEDADILVVAQKVVSKAEGRVVRMDEIEPSERALELADDRDPRHVEAILMESAQVVRVRPPLIITETRHGFICASAGVDASNAKGEGTLVLLPLDPDASAARIRDGLRERLGREVGVIVSDSFGRPFRQGTTDVALGAAGITPLLDLRGARPRRLRAAGNRDRGRRRARGRRAARSGQARRHSGGGRPRRRRARPGHGRDLVIPAERDLFR